MTNKNIRIFDDLESFEMRFDGYFSFDEEANGMIYSGQGIIFEERMTFSMKFTLKRLNSNEYSDTPTDFKGELEHYNKKFQLTEVIYDRDEDEFVFAFSNNSETIKLDCNKGEFKFCCDNLLK